MTSFDATMTPNSCEKSRTSHTRYQNVISFYKRQKIGPIQNPTENFAFIFDKQLEPQLLQPMQIEDSPSEPSITTTNSWLCREQPADDNSGSETDEQSSANLRCFLKIVRDASKTAFDLLPSGETLGAFANKHAVARYSRKIENKRERARESRRFKRKHRKNKPRN